MIELNQSIIDNVEMIQKYDHEVGQHLTQEYDRQKFGLEMIASENYASPAVMAAQGSILTNKYAEGYPQKRYYGGCQFVDQIETIAIERAKKLFNCQFANVQPHSGSQANMAAFLSILKTGDTILGMDLSHGGHLTHGSPVNFSGLLFKAESYQLSPETGLIDYSAILEKAQLVKPQLIIAGYSAYPRLLDFKKFREIADAVGAYLLVDMAHFAGLVATGLHNSPFPYADIVTSTTHKTLRGPRGGIILTNNEDLAKKINSKIFPGIQGGPLEHIIAAKAIAFGEALKPEFKSYMEQVLKNSQALASSLLKNNFQLVTGGSENHLVLLDLSHKTITGKEAEIALDEAGITVNKNTVPNEKRSPFVTSGIRLGTPALTSRGMKESHMELIGNWISAILNDPQNTELKKQIHQKVRDLCKEFPIYS